ncbi:MAG: DUF2079 domain-containing protein [Actinomycetia bacterium]|nr:DUF2079 domain-containing protein [Actinomycetes bacterium]MCP4226405.1 DUF2079 domain-containing protein [Actinomycetes bacterium]MCP5033478.1 DUF2079 domain-containing protein [Actinomycetes bacterium]
MSELPLRRRVERQAVRAQARLEAGIGDRWIPTAVTILLAAVIIWSGLAKLTSLDTGIDLAAYSQSSWLLSEAKLPKASLFGTDVHLLELHWAFVMYPLSLLALVFPPAKVLIVVQGLALGLAVVPLWWLARRVAKLRIGGAAALIGAYALHPATHRLGTEDFHPEALAVPALIGMAYFGAAKRWVPYWACIAFALACRADLGLAVALWGFVVLGHRERSVGVWTLGVGLVWSLGLLLVVQPIVGEAGVASSLFGYDGTSLGEVVLSSVRDPVSLLQDLLARENITLVVGLLAPVIFLPLLSMRHLAPALPLAVLYLIADLPAEAAFAERSSMLLAFIMIATTYALNRLGNMGVDRVFLDVRVLSTLAAAATLFFVSSSPISPYELPWQWSRQDDTDAAIEEAIGLIGDDVAVRASPSALARLSERPWLFALDNGRPPSVAQAGFPDFTRAVLILEREIPPRADSEREEFDRGMAAQGFVLLYDEDGVTLYSRQDGDEVGTDE